MLSNLGPRRTLKSNSTQTVGDGSNYWDHDDYDSMVDGSGSDGESLTSSNGKRRFRRAANHVRIFSEGADYSHVRSKVKLKHSLSLSLCHFYCMHIYAFMTCHERGTKNKI